MKMIFIRKNQKSLILLVLLVLSIFLCGCASTRIKRLSGKEFLAQAKEIEQINSLYWTTYVGSSSERAYLEHGYPAFAGNGTITTVLWTPLSELPDEIVQELKIGASPWKNPYENTE